MKVIQGSLFEDDYLMRTLGNIARDPEFALTELVANAWDAGSTKVDISIPSNPGEVIRVSDNGCGMTADQFKTRWMTLGYNRVKHQGKVVEFPDTVDGGGKRLAYGRNGIGRHAMLCFSNGYRVRTKRDGTLSIFKVRLSSGDHPFIITSEKFEKEKGHGTAVETLVERCLPEADEMRETISARFIHDPRFAISVNGKTLDLTTHPGAEAPVVLKVEDCGEVEVILVDTQKSARTKQKQGFAFWVGGRLVGEPSWTLHNSTPIDARTIFGRRFTILVKCDCMENELEQDWSGFRKGRKRNSLFKALSDFATSKYKEYSHEKVDETKRRVFEQNLSEIRNLNATAKDSVVEFVEAVMDRDPTIDPDNLSVAVQAVINLQQTRSGQHLLHTLSLLPSNDIEALDKLLSEWSAEDALIVLNEIDHRIATIKAIELLSPKPDTDELHTLHPLVTEARWLFGPEFESSEYASNLSLRNAVNKVFKASTKASDYSNSRKRPDLLMTEESTISAWALEEMDPSGLVTVSRVLLLELKRGNSMIGRKELNQAEEYIDEIRNSGHIDGKYYIHSFVIGNRVDSSVTLQKSLKTNDVEHSTIRGVCYATLTQTASKRLFRLKERLEERYSAVSQHKRSTVLDELLRQEVLNFAK